MTKSLTNYYRPLKIQEEWKELLVDPIIQWEDGKSAKELAKLWARSDKMPKSVSDLFPNDEIKPIFLFPEYPVQMPGIGKGSCNDLYVLTSTSDGYMPIMIEAKAGESFGPFILDWYKERTKNKDEGRNAATRLDGILEELGLKNYDEPPYQRIGALRYQLFHRTASALLEAKRIKATKALVLIQSFQQDPKGYEDFKQFLNLLSNTTQISKGKLIGPISINGTELYFAWLD